MGIIISELESKSELLSLIKDNNLTYLMLNTNKALERESIRINKETGEISDKKHPSFFEPKISHRYITTDFAEAQVEFITGTTNSSEDLYNHVNQLYDIFALKLEGELLSPYSMPPRIADLDKIKAADFGLSKDGKVAMDYRNYLIEKYGKKVQLISGVHYNFSFDEKFFEKLYKIINPEINYFRFKSEMYFKLMRNYSRFRYLTVLLFGASPICDESYSECVEGVSLRNSKYGYTNKKDVHFSLEDIDEFVKSIIGNIKDGKIYDEREIYSPIRLKTKSKFIRNDIYDSGIKYIEVRNLDINPYEKGGISIDTIKFMDLFLQYCLIADNCDCKTIAIEGNINSEIASLTRNYEEIITRCAGDIDIISGSLEVLYDMLEVFEKLDVDTSIINKYIDVVKKKNFLHNKVREDINAVGYENFIKENAKKYMKEAYDNRFKLLGYGDLELSTQILIREAVAQGLEIELLDRSDNFVTISNGDLERTVKQCTKTEVDSYIAMLIMENKVATKKVLSKKGIKVPQGDSFTKRDKAIRFALDMGNNFVIKPKSTNFGIGVNIYLDNPSLEEIEKGVDIALANDDTVLVEEYIKGNEYRFLVIGDEVAGILNRVPANVTGDGEKNIIELVEEKNKDSLRGKGYVTPLEKINIDDNARIFLKQHNKDEYYIPKKDEVVYLRRNSNISTGGDSVDITDEVHQKFKDIAVQASKSVNATFNGVDIIIDDYTDPNSNYSIIELNFNPAIHIHSYPYKGKERKIATKVLKALGFETK